MRTIRTNTNPRATDVAPQLQSVLNANGMQAHISMTETGTYQLVTMSHNSSQPRYYNINQKQLEALMNGGTTVWDKNAYNTFVSIVKNDYYIPGSFVAATQRRRIRLYGRPTFPSIFRTRFWKI